MSYEFLGILLINNELDNGNRICFIFLNEKNY